MATNKSHSKLAMELKTVNPTVGYSAGSRLIDVPINYQSKFYDVQTIASVSCKPVVYAGLPHIRIIANKLDCLVIFKNSYNIRNILNSY